MGLTSGGGSVITDGLIFYIDPANTKSYVGGSTSTDSLVGAITGSLINGTSFSSAKHGSWDFDGTDDRLEINDLANIPLANSSFNIWVRPNQGLGEGRAYQWCFTADASYPVMGLAYTPTDELGLATAPGSYDILSGNQGVNRFRLNTEVIKQMIEFHDDYHYKPVWDGTDKNLKEIEDYRVELGIPKNKTYVMPAGDTRDTLIEMYPKVFQMVAEHGYNMSGRDHIIAFNTERGV